MGLLSNLHICKDNTCNEIFRDYFCKLCGKYQKLYCDKHHKLIHKDINKIKRELR